MNTLYTIVENPSEEIGTRQVRSGGPINIAHDPGSHIVTINGIKFSEEFFASFAWILQAGMLFEFVKRLPDGAIEIREVYLQKPQTGVSGQMGG